MASDRQSGTYSLRAPPLDSAPIDSTGCRSVDASSSCMSRRQRHPMLLILASSRLRWQPRPYRGSSRRARLHSAMVEFRSAPTPWTSSGPLVGAGGSALHGTAEQWRTPAAASGPSPRRRCQRRRRPRRPHRTLRGSPPGSPSTSRRRTPPPPTTPTTPSCAHGGPVVSVSSPATADLTSTATAVS